MSSWRTSDTRKQAGGRLRPGNFQGTAPRGRSHEAEEAVIHSMEGQWFTSARYRRRARVTSGEVLTATGTVRLGLEVIDGEPFAFGPGQFVGVEAHFAGRGYRRSPYCILSPPSSTRWPPPFPGSTTASPCRIRRRVGPGCEEDPQSAHAERPWSRPY